MLWSFLGDDYYCCCIVIVDGDDYLQTSWHWFKAMTHFVVNVIVAIYMIAISVWVFFTHCRIVISYVMAVKRWTRYCQHPKHLTMRILSITITVVIVFINVVVVVWFEMVWKIMVYSYCFYLACSVSIITIAIFDAVVVTFSTSITLRVLSSLYNAQSPIPTWLISSAISRQIASYSPFIYTLTNTITYPSTTDRYHASAANH